VHSYYPTPADPADILAESDYAGVRFAAVIGRKNLAACQFHVEKSGVHGLRLLENFCKWNGQDGRSTWDGRDGHPDWDGKDGTAPGEAA